jgi:CTP-dependent riboflavin kinase
MNDDMIEISRNTAVRIVDILKEDLNRIDLEIQRGRVNRVGEAALNILENKRKTTRAIYEELKAVGVEGLESTVDMLEPPR